MHLKTPNHTHIPSWLIIIYIFSYYLWPLNSSPKVIYYSSFGLLLIYTAITRIKPSPFCRHLVGAALALILYILVSTLWASCPSPLDNFFYHSKRAFEIIALILIISCFFDTKHHITIFKGAVIIATLHSIIIMVSHNLATRILNPIDTAMVYGIAAIIAMFFALKEDRYQTILFFTSLTILLFFMLETKSRGPQLSFVITASALFLIKKEKYKKVFYYLAAIAPVAIFTVATTNILSKIFSRGFNVSQRDIIWKETIVNGIDNFWFGIGMQKKVMLHLPNGYSYTHSHNLFLDTFRLTGFIGFFLIVFLYIYALQKGIRSKHQEYQLWALILLFGGICLMTNGSIPFNRPSHAWLAFWVPIAMICTLPQQNIKQPTG